MRLGGLQSRPGRGDEKKNSQPLPGCETPMIQVVAQCYTTELSRLLRLSTVYNRTIFSLVLRHLPYFFFLINDNLRKNLFIRAFLTDEIRFWV
jgi:hypothetical protein